MADEDGAGLRDRLARQGEDALGKLATDLIENPLINGAITRAFSAREKAVHAQEAAMGALNLPSAADIDRLTRRLRTVGTRLEGLEEGIDRLQEGIEQLGSRLESLARGAEPGVADRLEAVEGQLASLAADVSTLAGAIDVRPAPLPREQERLAVDPPPKPTRRRASKSAKD